MSQKDTIRFYARLRKRSKVLEITIPRKVVRALNLNPGDIVEIVLTKRLESLEKV